MRRVLAIAAVTLALATGTNGAAAKKVAMGGKSASGRGAQSATTEGHYDHTFAMSSLFFARAAACSSANIKSWDCGVACAHHPNFVVESVYDNSTAQSQAYSGYDPDTSLMVVSIRGSQNLLNWLYDFDYAFDEYPHPACTGCKVHHGFHAEWLSIKEDILADYARLRLKHPHMKGVQVTGHSLGAAVSILAGVDLVQAGAPNVTVYNFGEPRVGNPAFAAWVSESALPQGRQFRVTHKDDPVPRVPPLEFGYLHTPHELWYDNDGNTTWTDCVDSATAEDLACSAGQIAFVPMDHMHYLGHWAGCSDSSAEEQAQVAAEMRRVAPVLQKMLRK